MSKDKNILSFEGIVTLITSVEITAKVEALKKAINLSAFIRDIAGKNYTYYKRKTITNNIQMKEKLNRN